VFALRVDTTLTTASPYFSTRPLKSGSARAVVAVTGASDEELVADVLSAGRAHAGVRADSAMTLKIKRQRGEVSVELDTFGIPPWVKD
jgi:hypothetical protein